MAVSNFTHTGAVLVMTIGKNHTVYYDSGNPMSMLDAIQETMVAKMTALQQSFDDQLAEITKSAIADVTKAERRDVLAAATMQVMNDIQKEALAEVEKIKKLPQPAKGVADAGVVSKGTAEKLAAAFRDGQS